MTFIDPPHTETVGFLGPDGSHSAVATALFLKSDWLRPRMWDVKPMASFMDVLNGVEASALSLGIIPVENALEGSVTEVLEGLHQVSVSPWVEFTRPIIHGLLVKPGTETGMIKTVYSHPQALGQCRQTLQQMWGGDAVAVLPCASTAQAAELVLHDPTATLAALGTHEIANIHGLTVLHPQMSDQPDNQTRFLVIAAKGQSIDAIIPVETLLPLPVKTSLRLDVGHYPGSLVDALLVFKRANINMTKIESRPSRKGLGRYQFYIDVAADMTENPGKTLISDLRQYFCEEVHVLGPYYQLGQIE